MKESSAQSKRTFEDAHPLAQRLIDDACRRQPSGPVIEIGAGAGRNTRALAAAGLEVVAIDDAAPYTQLPAARASMEAALSTHGYLHGTASKLRAGIAELARVLRTGARAYVTLGSVDDVNYGFGEQIDEHTFAPGDGPEAGIPHVYLDRHATIEMFCDFTIEELELVDVDRIVGRWAHSSDEPPGKKHWFLIARRA
jgi:SAM-dependent methyltransferase